jgi:hypothetical protein
LTIAFAWIAWVADKNAKEAQRRLYEANYNLAKVFEEKALNALEDGEYKGAWLYASAALQQEIEPASTAMTWQATSSLLAP